jgi:transcriptional regulator with XRE-family HTH domain
VRPKGQSASEDTVAPTSGTDPDERGSRIPLKRGPYRAPAVRPPGADMRPSRVLAENIRGYRVLRQMTQDQLAARMDRLGHRWSRSVVSTVEGSRRSVSIDEVFGLAISLEVTVGRLIDPAGPDGSRNLGLDVGLGRVGQPNPLPTELGRLFASSCAVLRVVDEKTGMINVDMVSNPPTPPHDRDGLEARVGSPLRRLGTTPGT